MATKQWIEMDARHEFLQDGYGKDAEGGSPQSTDLAESSLKGALRETQRKKKVMLKKMLELLFDVEQ